MSTVKLLFYQAFLSVLISGALNTVLYFFGLWLQLWDDIGNIPLLFLFGVVVLSILAGAIGSKLGGILMNPYLFTLSPDDTLFSEKSCSYLKRHGGLAFMVNERSRGYSYIEPRAYCPDCGSILMPKLSLVGSRHSCVHCNKSIFTWKSFSRLHHEVFLLKNRKNIPFVD